MAKKVVNKTKGQEVTFIPARGTGQARYGHGSVSASLTTLNRIPIVLPVAKAQDPKGEFLLNLLTQAGRDGLTWPQMQQALKEKFGAAPKKRHSLYAVLRGVVWHKEVGAKGICTYYLGKAKAKRTRKTA